ncbi:MAG: ATP-binding protein [Chloroflexi bacterium]|nr:ATP-binding protein [Chloroflexota bacterium]
MSFEWLNKFHKGMAKPDDYAEKTLAQYRMGMKAKGAIAGVAVLIDEAGCDACKELDPEAVYHPDDAPRLPLPDCTKGRDCRCVYRPVMKYQVKE